MALSERLAIIIDANGAGAVREFNKVGNAAERELGKTEDSTKRLGQNLTRVGAVMIGVGAVLVGGAYKAAQAFEQDQMAVLKLQNTLERMPRLAGASTQAFLDQASALQQVTKYADDQTISAQAMLGTFHLTEQQILDILPLVQDYASKFGTDLVDASKQVGKALMGQRGALQRNGVLLDENAYATDRFGAVMDALRENAGGFAETEAKTLSGQLQILKNNLGDVAEVIGGGAAQAFGTMLAPLQAVGSTLKGLPPVVGETVGGFAAFGGVGLIVAGAASVVIGQVMLMKERFVAAYGAAKRFFVFVRAQSLTTIGSVAGVAAAVVGLHFAFDALSKRLVDNKFNVFKEDSDRARMALEHFANTGQLLSSLDAELDRLRQNMNDTEGGVGGLAKAFLEFGTTGNSAADTLLRLGGLFDDYADNAAADAVAEDIRQLDNWLTQLGQQSGPQAERAFAMIVEQLGLQGATVDELNQMFPSYTGFQQDAAESTGALDAKTRDLVESLKEQKDALDALFNPIFAAVDAQDNLREAQQASNEAAWAVIQANHDYQEAVRNSGEGSDEAAEALARLEDAQKKQRDASIDVTKANVRNDSAMRDLAKSLAEGGVTTQDFENRLRGWIEQGTLTKQEAAFMRDEFYRVRDAAGSVPDTIQTNIISNAGTVLGQFYEILGITQSIGGRVTSALDGAVQRLRKIREIEGRAIGGPVTARTPYLVGENGPELFVPDGSGRIIPDDRTRDLLGSQGKANRQGEQPSRSGDVNVYVNKSDASPYEIGRELLWTMKVAG